MWELFFLMTTRSLLHAAIAALFLVLPLSGCVKPGSVIECLPQVNQALRQMSIPASNVRSMSMHRKPRGRNTRSGSAMDAWVRLNSCSGNVVVVLTRKCYFQHAYTAGDCSVAGLPRY